MKGARGLLFLTLLGFLPLSAQNLPRRPVEVSSGSVASVSPISGSVRFKDTAISGATIIVRGLSKGIESLIWMARTEKDGSFVWSSAPPGVYSLAAFLGASKSAVFEVRHEGKAGDVLFVPLELDRDPRVLPDRKIEKESMWITRAVYPADPLREENPSSPPEAPESRASTPLADPEALTSSASPSLPLRANVASVAGRDIDAGRALSRTSIGVGGQFGKNLKWDLEGEYGFSESTGAPMRGDVARVALEIGSLRDAPPLPGQDDPIDPGVGKGGRLRVETRREAIPFNNSPEAFVSEHSVDAVIPAGTGASASVSARMVSQTNYYQTGLVADLFASQSDALEIQARYRNDVSERTFVQANVAYRADSRLDPVSQTRASIDLQEARMAAGAGTKISEWVSIEGAVAGDYSEYARAIVPEVRVRWDSGNGLRFTTSASQRFEQDLNPYSVQYGHSGISESEMTRYSRAVYRAAVQFSPNTFDSISLEGIHREVSSTFRYVLDRNFIQAIDSIYMFNGDQVNEIAVSTTFRIGDRLHARLLVRGGIVRGNRIEVIQDNDAAFSQGEAALSFVPTRTDLAIRYRSVDQSISRDQAILRNDLEALEISLAQVLPLPILRAIGSEWRALLSFETGTRMSRDNETSLNRRVSGGLGISF